MRFYHWEEAHEGLLHLPKVTCKEQAWAYASNCLRQGDYVIASTRALDLDFKRVGNRIYDSTGHYHFIGSVVAYMRDDGSICYLEPLNPDP